MGSDTTQQLILSRPVLDKGYVKLVGVTADISVDADGNGVFELASDLDPVADARVSTAKTATILGPSELRTLNFLLREEHTSPFRGCVVKLEVRAPLFVCRQWWKYIIGSDPMETPVRDPFTAWNEESRRYVEEEPEFYIPEYWRKAAEKRTQGSIDEPHGDSSDFTKALLRCVRTGVNNYEYALEQGVAAEQARFFLPAYVMYTRFRWTVSLQGLCHFLRQRLAHDAQNEITKYAVATSELTVPLWPTTIREMTSKGKNSGTR